MKTSPSGHVFYVTTEYSLFEEASLSTVFERCVVAVALKGRAAHGIRKKNPPLRQQKN
jgi:hypothetical protein